MAKPFKFRYVSELVGSSVLIVLVLAFVGIVMASKAQGWFEKTYLLNLRCPEEGSFGLTEGSAVEVLGIRVGSVERIEVDPARRILAVARIKAPFFENFINSGSRASVKKVWGIAGDAYVEITRGLPGAPPLPQKGAQLDLVKDTQLIELAEGLLSDVRGTIVPAIDEIKATAAEFRKVASELRRPEGNLQQALRRVEEVTEMLRHGKGPLPRMIHDEALGEEAAAVLSELKESLQRIQGAVREIRKAADTAGRSFSDARLVLQDLKEITSQLAPVGKALQEEAADLPGLLSQTKETLRQTEILVRGLQRHWLLRGSMPPQETAPPLPPEAARPDEGP